MTEPSTPNLQERLKRIRCATAGRPRVFPLRELLVESAGRSLLRGRVCFPVEVEDGLDVLDFLRRGT